MVHRDIRDNMYRYAHAEIYIIYQAVYILVAHREPARMQARIHTHTRARIICRKVRDAIIRIDRVYCRAFTCICMDSYVCI